MMFTGSTRAENMMHRSGKCYPEQSCLSHPDDSELTLRHLFHHDARKGYELLFQCYYQPLCSYAARIVSSGDVARDIVAELLLTFWQREIFRKVTSSIRAYLFIAVRNRALKHLRREERIDKNAASPDMGGVVLTPEQTLLYDELYAQVEAGMQELPQQCQKVFFMSRFEGKRYRDIAESLGISQKAVEAHVSRALVILRKAIRNAA